MKKGWMIKQGGFVKSWKKRYFVITGTEVHYYAEEGKNEKGSFNLSHAKKIGIADCNECARQPALKVEIVKPKNRIYYFQTTDIADRDSWIEAFQNATKKDKSSEISLSSSKSVSSGLITVDDFEFLKVLGRGSFGKVQLVKYKRDNQYYAMKYMKKKKIFASGQINQTFAERDILVKIHHPFLVSAHFSFQNEDKIFLVLDFINGGDLRNHINDSKRLTETEARFYAAQILLGLGALHSKGYIYRDLKPENILIEKDGYIKITDFGLIKKDLKADSASHTTFCGTPYYLAPEIIREESYSNSVDWWSFGIVIYEMIAGETPFHDQNMTKMYHKILHGKINFPDFFSHDAKDLISKLLDKNLQNENNIRTRLGSQRDFEEIKEHPFFNEIINWDDLLNKNIEPEWTPEIDDVLDTSHFSQIYTNETPGITAPDDTAIQDPINFQFSGFTSVEPSNF
ncbi:hypothetical protein M9Y10_022139 [Tritrichomonas musculus]|uniref:non-specific serine/threonine protein kinase n=1 Tax=Tritrichomonas musculus TaxID=1915356 RepID=A0ABR2KRQ7_9EUKA